MSIELPVAIDSKRCQLRLQQVIASPPKMFLNCNNCSKNTFFELQEDIEDKKYLLDCKNLGEKNNIVYITKSLDWQKTKHKAIGSKEETFFELQQAIVGKRMSNCSEPLLAKRC